MVTPDSIFCSFILCSLFSTFMLHIFDSNFPTYITSASPQYSASISSFVSLPFQRTETRTVPLDTEAIYNRSYIIHTPRMKMQSSYVSIPLLSTLLLVVSLGRADVSTVSTVMATVTAAPAPVPTSTQYTNDTEFRNATLTAHNFYRSEHNATALVWNETSAKFAENWASKCSFEHTVCLGSFRYLFMLYCSSKARRYLLCNKIYYDSNIN